MRHIKLLGLAFLAVFAVSAVASAVASAAEFGGPFPNKFTSTSGAGSLKAAGSTVTCTSDTNVGEVTGAKTAVKIVVTFKGCKLGNTECKNAGKEEIVTKSLKAEPVDLDKAKTKVGLLMSPEAAGPFVEFKCGLVTVKVTGSVIGQVTPVGVKTKLFTLAFREVGGKQEWTKVEEEGAAHELEAFGGKAVLVNEDKITTEKETEIKA